MIAPRGFEILPVARGFEHVESNQNFAGGRNFTTGRPVRPSEHVESNQNFAGEPQPVKVAAQ